MDILNYLRSLNLYQLGIVSMFFLVAVLAVYSAFRKRRSTEN